MKRKYLFLVLVIILVMVSSSNSVASDRRFKVLFVIPPTVDADLASEARSYITGELRELGDVEIVGKDPTMDCFLISVFPAPIMLNKAVIGGIVLSYVIEKNEYIEHNVVFGSRNELKLLCQRVVAYFDTHWLQRERKQGR